MTTFLENPEALLTALMIMFLVAFAGLRKKELLDSVIAKVEIIEEHKPIKGRKH